MTINNDKIWKWLRTLPFSLKAEPDKQLIKLHMPLIITALLGITWGTAIILDGRNLYRFSNSTTSANPTLAITPANSTAPTFNITNATALHLFGKAEITPAEIDPATLPDATTNLKLVGLLASSRPGASRSLIAESGNPAKYYSEGDNLPGSIKLFRIENDCVIVQRGDQFEKLSLPSSSIGKTVTPLRSIAEFIKPRLKNTASEAPPAVSTKEADKSAGPQAIYQALDASLAALQKKKK